jgi:hypothetical protein
METSENYCFSVYRYSNYLILPFGLILNSISIPIFRLIIKNEPLNQKNNLFKYLLMKSICDSVYSIVIFGNLIYQKHDGSVDTSLVLQIYYVFIGSYLVVIVTTLSSYFEVLATFDCFLMISNVFKSFKTFSFFKMSSIGIIIAAFIFHIPTIFYYNLNSFTVIDINNDSDVSIHKAYNLTFSFKNILIIHTQLSFISRDLIPLISLFFLNIFILIKMNKVTKQKMKMMKNRSELNSITNALIAQRKKVNMIFFTSLIYLFHLPFAYKVLKQINERKCFSLISIISYRLSFSINFFSYFLFNNNFRKYFYQLFAKNSSNRIHNSRNL